MTARLQSALLLILLINASLSGQITPEESISFVEPSSITLAPDGKMALFIVSTVDLKANTNLRQLMEISTDSGGIKPVEGVPRGVATVRWAPDSRRFAYIASGAIWVQNTGSAHPMEICKYGHSNAFLSKEGNTLAWSPDGTQIAFAGTLEPAPKASDPILVDRIQYKSRTSLSDSRRTHIYVVAASGGAPKPLTAGNFDEHSLDWGGNGKEIVFLSNHEKDPDARLNYDVFAVEVSSGRIRQITRTPGVEYSPVMSPDARWIAVAATSRAITTIDSVAEDTHIHLIPASGGPGKDLNAALDRRSSAPQWRADGRSIYFLASDHGKTLIFTGPVDGGPTRPLFDNKLEVTSFSQTTNALLYIASDPVHPAEVYSSRGQISHLNDWARMQFSTPERLSYKSFDGTQIEGWFYPALKAGGRIPMILTIHGGPHGQFGYAFTPAIQLNSARGYATLAINPRGSAGYGQRFADGTLADWGGGDYKDLMAGVDYTLEHHHEIDPNRLGVTGPSYGGYMTNWVITQTNRFKAAVAVSSLSNLISFYATSLYQDLLHAEFGGYPWDGDRYAVLWKVSPVAHISKVSTPTLLLHGEADNDVHITQAEEMFTALKQRGVAAEMVRYPREGHGFHEPKHLLDSRVRTLNWMDRFLQPYRAIR